MFGSEFMIKRLGFQDKDSLGQLGIGTLGVSMRKERIEELINKLLHEIEEEDIGISLFSTLYQNHEELIFFKNDDKERVLQILKKLSEDSKRHKEILKQIITNLGKKIP